MIIPAMIVTAICVHTGFHIWKQMTSPTAMAICFAGIATILSYVWI